MWDAASVALLKKLWASGHSPGQIASRLARAQPQRRVREVAALRPEAKPQIANRQAQDRVDPEAKTGAVGSLRPTGR